MPGVGGGWAGQVAAGRCGPGGQPSGVCNTHLPPRSLFHWVHAALPKSSTWSATLQGYANELANAETDEQLAQLVQGIMEREGVAAGACALCLGRACTMSLQLRGCAVPSWVDTGCQRSGPRPQTAAVIRCWLTRQPTAAPAGPGVVMIAHDTRPSGPGLADAAAAGVACLGVTPEMVGLLTTPQLHWMVRSRNAGRAWDEASYLAELSGAFKRLVAGAQPLGQVGSRCRWAQSPAGVPG